MNHVKEIFSCRTPTGQHIGIRSWTFRSHQSDAPTYTFTCGLHGDEQAGIAVCLSLLRELEVLSEADVEFDANARIIACGNPLSLLVSRRMAPFDRADWNRLLPLEDGDFGERIIDAIIRNASDSTYFIDLHGGENFVRHVPQAIIFPGYFPEDANHERKALEVASRLKLPLIQIEDASERSPFKYTVAYSVARATKAIPIIVELGVGSRVYPSETTRLAQAMAVLVCPSATIGTGARPDPRVPMREYHREDLEIAAAARGGIFSPFYSRLYQTLLNMRDLDVEGLSEAEAADVGQITKTLPDTHFQLLADTGQARGLLQKIFEVAKAEAQVLIAMGPSGGLRTLTIRPGDLFHVGTGALLGHIYQIDGSKPIEVRAPDLGSGGGLLVAVRRHPVVYEGSTLAAFTTDWRTLGYVEPL